ncbi:hypothetical protein CRG98_022462 [Punica granatum]|uniref:Uncharacterized protein n=1 Tax=Punica granatum TaxID=22663 RepID=A0A2I0JLL2_PUNGR|nr:hypothetical protein CRG98_022462 [Punica granatum]
MPGWVPIKGPTSIFGVAQFSTVLARGPFARFSLQPTDSSLPVLCFCFDEEDSRFRGRFSSSRHRLLPFLIRHHFVDFIQIWHRFNAQNRRPNRVEFGGEPHQKLEALLRLLLHCHRDSCPAATTRVLQVNLQFVPQQLQFAVVFPNAQSFLP